MQRGPSIEEVIAARLEADAVLLAASLAAASAWAVGGLVALRAPERRIVVPLAHLGRIAGAPLADLVRLAGAWLRPVGTVDACAEAAFARALDEKPAAALLYLDGKLPEVLAPARFLWLCRQAQVPAVVLDPNSGRWAAWADGGAALVVLDGGALLGVEVGLIAGSAEAITACRALSVAAAFAAPATARSALAAALAAREQGESEGT